MTARLGLKGQLGTLFREPSLLLEAMRTAIALRRRRGVSPSSAYLGWRMETAYGTGNATTRSDDLVHYLRWRRRMRRLAGWAI